MTFTLVGALDRRRGRASGTLIQKTLLSLQRPDVRDLLRAFQAADELSGSLPQSKVLYKNLLRLPLNLHVDPELSTIPGAGLHLREDPLHFLEALLGMATADIPSQDVLRPAEKATFVPIPSDDPVVRVRD